jgi:hypothetical protein
MVGCKGDVETWIVQGFCNAGTLLDAVLAGDSKGFFVDEIPQMVRLEGTRGRRERGT